MDKLVFFAMKSPDKLDRIGEYLEQRLSRDIARQRYGCDRVRCLTLMFKCTEASIMNLNA